MEDSEKNLRIYFVTWNVATKYPEDDPRELFGITPDNAKPLPDLYFVGYVKMHVYSSNKYANSLLTIRNISLQEVKSQPQNIVLDMFFEDPWTKLFREVLKEYDYVKIRSQRLQGLVLNAFCLRKHITRLRLIEAQYTRTGFGGMWGNKGAVSIRLNIYGVSICVVNTHLTPHDHLLEDRISDYNVILKEHSFGAPDTPNILFHDYAFWIGDLNFRLNGENELTATDIDLMVKEKQLEPLLAKDQLKMVMQTGRAFAELSENPVTFPPTYKYEFGSQEFDLKRRPSWTDRILYKVNADVYEDVKLNAVQRNYKSYPRYTQSDHKPVSAEFDITIRPEVADYGVEFQPVSAWFIDEENSVSYKLTGDAKPTSGDWVGLFHNEFSSLDEYVVYEYVARGGKSSSSFTAEPDELTERIYFSDTALRAPGMYRLVYVAQQGDLVGILGVSPPFPGHRRQTIPKTT